MKYLITCVCFVMSFVAPAQKLTRFVDPFLGTGGHGHVYPGATTPFGMVQLSPDNGVNGWDWCSGYHYSSKTIAGFSHTHLSGTGIGDLCDISVLPLTDTSQIREKYILLPFSHANEKASPGYYSVQLDSKVNCELTTTARNGYHRYTFPGKQGWLRFDMGFAINWDAPTDAMLSLYDDSTLIGFRSSTGWAKGQSVFFAARFSKPVRDNIFVGQTSTNGNEIRGPLAKMVLKFDTEDEPLLVRVGLSSTGTMEALHALKETKGLSFNQVAKQAEKQWEQELQKIVVDTSDRAFAQKFYTALYRTALSPNLYSDEDGKYRVHDNKIRKQQGNKYTVFSNWDTFRALNPLFTITQPGKVPELVNSMLSFYNDNGLLPVWDLNTWETNTMTGYHAIPIIADAILKNIPGFDHKRAYEAMTKSAHQQQRGTPEYIRFGYLPQDKHGWSVTITLEYAFDDWCIAQVAKKMGKMADYDHYNARAMSYKKLFDPVSGFMRAKDSTGKFIEPFDPLLSEHGFEGQYIEGTAWQHSFFVPHDVDGFAALYGGKPQLVKKLDELFNSPSVLHGTNTSDDVSGLIGQYAHGNEPSHHIIYMYTTAGHPEKAAQKIRVVVDSLYKTGPDGLSGNDDCGQMSAWLVWSALGMYPMNPASGTYVFGYPLVNSAVIQLPGGKKMTIKTKGDLVKDPARKSYISKVFLNGKEIPVKQLSHQQLLNGGELIYQLAD